MVININVYKYAYKYARINMYKNMHNTVCICISNILTRVSKNITQIYTFCKI